MVGFSNSAKCRRTGLAGVRISGAALLWRVWWSFFYDERLFDDPR
jgi:hypothetical protein